MSSILEHSYQFRKMTGDESVIVKEKLKDVCPDKRLQDMYMVDVEEKTLEIFDLIGYKSSKTVKKAIDKAWVNSDRSDHLYEFIYRVWSFDNEQ